MQAAKRLFPRLHTLFAYTILMKSPTLTSFDMKIYIENQNKIAFTHKIFKKMWLIAGFGVMVVCGRCSVCFKVAVERVKL